MSQNSTYQTTDSHKAAHRITARLRASLSQRIYKYVTSKRGQPNPPLTLVYNRIFILPATFGFGFGVMLLLIAVGSLNFNNNLALLFAFMLGALALLTAMLAYRNLVDIRIDQVYANPVFAGEEAVFKFPLQDQDQRPRHVIELFHDSSRDCVDMLANGKAELSLSILAKQRGWLAAPRARLETCYPMGMFRAWSWVAADTQCLVYPAPAEHPPPIPESGSGIGSGYRLGDGDQFHGLRDYQDGDALKRLAWRATARHDQLFTKQYEIPTTQACDLEWDSLTGYEEEQRLSILTSWVLQAEKQKIDYRLLMPGLSLGPGQGDKFRDDCLKVLALWGV